MSSLSTNLLIPLIAQAQNNKEITFNTAIDLLDEALDEFEAVTAVVAADVIITPAQFVSSVFCSFTGAPASNKNVILPTGQARFWIIKNDTTSSPPVNLIFKVGTAAQTVTITDSNAHMIYSDGVSNVFQVS